MGVGEKLSLRTLCTASDSLDQSPALPPVPIILLDPVQSGITVPSRFFSSDSRSDTSNNNNNSNDSDKDITIACS
jgi:hypothetical protein